MGNRGFYAKFRKTSTRELTDGRTNFHLPTYNVSNISGDYTLNDNDYTILVDASNGSVTLTLPPAVGNAKLDFDIKRIDDSDNSVSIKAVTGEEIDGANAFNLDSQYEAVKVRSNGTAWWIF